MVEVLEVATLSAGLVRITFGGEDLADFEAGAFSDHYVKLHFPPPGATYSPPFDPAEIRTSAPREHWSLTRTYTVRAWDPERRRLTVDFVVHGDTGVAGPWARAARVGDAIQFVGPGGAYVPDPDIGWQLFVGDESAVPAIAASLERVPAGATAHAVIQVPALGHQIPLACAGALRIQWSHGSDEQEIVEAVRALEFPAQGSVQAFVHGEATMVRVVRRHLLLERGLAPEALSASGYWKRDRTEDGWREDKAEWNRLAERDIVST